MKHILIIEDEAPAAKRIEKLILALDPKIKIVGVLDSIEESLAWFQSNPKPDLIFSDIQLADGLSFKIFESLQLDCPIIFTTAYDEYAIKAFQHYSIDYLLKPIQESLLEKAWEKFKNLTTTNQDFRLEELIQNFKNERNFRERFLVKKGEDFHYIMIEEVAYFFSDTGLSFLVSKNGKQFIIDDKLDQLESQLNGKHFYRINRKFIIRDTSIVKISSYFNSRLKLQISPDPKQEIIVSRERVSSFKEWLDH